MIRAAALSLALAASPLAAQDVISDGVNVIEVGVTCGSTITGQRENEDSASGYVFLIGERPIFVSNGREVPTVPGMGFGLIFTTTRPYDDVTAVVLHPPFDGSGIERQSFSTSYTGEAEHYRIYQFDYRYELAPGPWTLEAWQGEELIYRLHFTVVEADETHPVARACGTEPPIS